MFIKKNKNRNAFPQLENVLGEWQSRMVNPETLTTLITRQAKQNTKKMSIKDSANLCEPRPGACDWEAVPVSFNTLIRTLTYCQYVFLCLYVITFVFDRSSFFVGIPMEHNNKAMSKSAIDFLAPMEHRQGSWKHYSPVELYDMNIADSNQVILYLRIYILNLTRSRNRLLFVGRGFWWGLCCSSFLISELCVLLSLSPFCALFQVFPVSLTCPLLIALQVFSKVYFNCLIGFI